MCRRIAWDEAAKAAGRAEGPAPAPVGRDILTLLIFDAVAEAKDFEDFQGRMARLREET